VGGGGVTKIDDVELEAVDLTADVVVADPYPHYERFRAAGVPAWNDAARCLVVVDYRTSVEVLEASPQLSMQIVGEDATSTARRAFRRALRRQLRTDGPLVRRAPRYADRFERAGGDVIAELVVPVVVGAVGDAFGLPGELAAAIAQWSPVLHRLAAADLGANAAGRPDDAVDAAEAYAAFADFLEHHRGALADALRAEAAACGSSVEELTLLLLTTVNAAYWSTVGAVGAVLLAVLTEPAVAAAASRVDGTATRRRLVDEIVRHDAPLQVLLREATEPWAFGALQLGEGDRVAVVVGAANRDPAVYDQPDEIRLDRRSPGHLGFGRGPHACIGTAVACHACDDVLDAVLPRLERLEAAGEPRWATVPGTRCLEELPLVVRSARSRGRRPTASVARSVAGQLLARRGVAAKAVQLLSALPGDEGPDKGDLRSLLVETRRAMAAEEVRALLVRELGSGAERIRALRAEPIATASIGQVHLAEVDGVPVAVKVQYPGIGTEFERQLWVVEKLAAAAAIAASITPGGGRDDIRRAGRRIRASLSAELDYDKEREALEAFVTTAAGTDAVVPRPFVELCGPTVLVMEHLDGLDIGRASSAPLQLRNAWGRAVLRFVTRGVYIHGLFQSDLHAANFSFRPDGRVNAFDFGCTGTLGRAAARQWALWGSAAARRDDETMTAAMTSLGFLDGGGPPSPAILEWARRMFLPVLTDGPFDMTSPAARALSPLESMRRLGRRDRDRLRFPEDALLVGRAIMGVQGLLGALGVSIDWRVELENVWDEAGLS